MSDTLQNCCVDTFVEESIIVHYISLLLCATRRTRKVSQNQRCTVLASPPTGACGAYLVVKCLLSPPNHKEVTEDGRLTCMRGLTNGGEGGVFHCHMVWSEQK